jgi:hypothetical protein
MTVRRDSDVFGKLPQGATHFSVRTKGPLAWEWCTYAGPSGVATHEFPIAELSLATIRKRWGSGTYRLMFVALVRGTRQVFGNGKIFELTAPERSATPRPTGSGAGRRSPVAIARVGLVASSAPAPEDHTELVHALLASGAGKRDGQELFQSLAVPVGMALGSAFSSIEKLSARFEAVERRLASIEASLGSRAGTDSGADRLDRMLDKLDSIEARLERPATRRRTPSR